MSSFLPADFALRGELHHEIHARPPANIHLPALVFYVAVLNQGVSVEAELAHLRLLKGQQDLQPEDVAGNFVRLQCDGFTLKWERHSEYSRYSIVQPLTETISSVFLTPRLFDCLLADSQWIKTIPGQTLAAIAIAMQPAAIRSQGYRYEDLKAWFPDTDIVASLIGANSHSCAASDFVLREDGVVRMAVFSEESSPGTRAGRLAQRLLELETYRLLALRGLSESKKISPILAELEHSLGEVTSRLEANAEGHEELFGLHMAMAAKVERAIADSSYRFAATMAYEALVNQRIEELRERTLPGTPSIGEFVRRRLSPASATVASTSRRLASLSDRVGRSSALLRAHVDIATEAKSQQLLEKLAIGQRTQLRLQVTVEGLSIAAITYYVTSLIAHGVHALEGLGIALHAEVVAGACIPLVALMVWRFSRRVHKAIDEHMG